ncbi:bifunctional diguanylate cyclase/phosphodiesterase [Oceanobacillus arenosus]|nr:bifunctional diguanylate cyclase/phosphodiesterase [Oceanobacillus arenosus]
MMCSNEKPKENHGATLCRDVDLFYQTLFEYNPDMVFFLDWEGIIAKANNITLENLKYTAEELVLQPVENFVPSYEIDKYKDALRQALSGSLANIDTAFVRSDGEILNIYLSMMPALNDGRVVGVFAIAQDVTEQRKIEKEYLETELKFRSIVEQALFGFFIIQDEKIIYTNAYFRELMAIDEPLDDKNLWELLHDDNKSKLKSMIDRLVAGREAMTQYLQLHDADGNKIDVEVHAMRLIYQNEWTIIGTVHDVTEQKRTEALNEFITYHDYLTGLPNRRAFDKKLEAELDERKDSNQQVAILYLDLDRFKYINDSLGHVLGDAFIKQVSIRIQQSLKAHQYIARMNAGDEFAILLLTPGDEQEAVEQSKQILKALQKPFVIDRYQLTITTSIGISIFPTDAEDAETMMMHAHTALHDAKESGKNTFRFYSSAMHPAAYDTLVLENDLRNAINLDQLELFFQPKVNSDRNEIVGVEALIRWNHPERGLLLPGVFIPLAEETGLITEIEKWVEFTACKQNKAWQDAGLRAIPISVNLTADRILGSDMVQNIRQVLKETKLNPSYLEIEFTESTLLKSEHGVIAILDELRSLGVRISLDDFGTGYSSLSYLNRFRGRIDTLKLDRSFISELSFADEAESNFITKVIIELAQHLKMSVVAEGVETEEQLQVLKDYNCETIQGFLYSKPIPAEDFAVLLEKGK